MWIMFITVFSIIFITSLGDCTRPNTPEEIPIFAGIASKFENVGPIFSPFNPCLSLPSVARDDEKQFQCLNIDLNNKTGPLFLKFN